MTRSAALPSGERPPEAPRQFVDSPVPADLVRHQVFAQGPRLRVDVENGQAAEDDASRVGGGSDLIVRVEPSVGTEGHPAIQRGVRARRPALDDIVLSLGQAPVGGDQPVVADEHQGGGEGGDHESGHRGAVEADAGRLHGRDLVLTGQDPIGGQSRDQHGHGQDLVEEVVGHVVQEVARQGRALDPVLLDVVEEIHELEKHGEDQEGHGRRGTAFEGTRGRCTGPGRPPGERQSGDRPRLRPAFRREEGGGTAGKISEAERIDGPFAPRAEEEDDGQGPQDDVGAPDRDRGRQGSGIAGLLAQSGQDVIDEDHRDGQAESGGFRVPPPPEHEGEAQHRKDQRHHGQCVLLVILDRVASRFSGIALALESGNLSQQHVRGHLAIAAGQGQVGEDLAEVDGELALGEPLNVVGLSLHQVEGVGASRFECEFDSFLRRG